MMIILMIMIIILIVAAINYSNSGALPRLLKIVCFAPARRCPNQFKIHWESDNPFEYTIGKRTYIGKLH